MITTRSRIAHLYIELGIIRKLFLFVYVCYSLQEVTTTPCLGALSLDFHMTLKVSGEEGAAIESSSEECGDKEKLIYHYHVVIHMARLHKLEIALLYFTRYKLTSHTVLSTHPPSAAM